MEKKRVFHWRRILLRWLSDMVLWPFSLLYLSFVVFSMILDVWNSIGSALTLFFLAWFTLGSMSFGLLVIYNLNKHHDPRIEWAPKVRQEVWEEDPPVPVKPPPSPYSFQPGPSWWWYEEGQRILDKDSDHWWDEEWYDDASPSPPEKRKATPAPTKKGKKSSHKVWSRSEVETIIDDYLEMLDEKRRGGKPNKAQHIRSLMPRLDGRTKGSIEYKHRNISAILEEEGHEHLGGYRPLYNYQALLREVLLEKIKDIEKLPFHFVFGSDLSLSQTDSDPVFLAKILSDWPAYSESKGDLKFKKTWIETLIFYKKGLSVEDIAIERKLTRETIAKHLTILIKMKVIKDFSNLIEDKFYKFIRIYVKSNYLKSDFSPFNMYDEYPETAPPYGHIDLFLAIIEAKLDDNFADNTNLEKYTTVLEIYQNPVLDRDEKILELSKYNIPQKEIGSLTGVRATTVNKVATQNQNIQLKNTDKKLDTLKEINRGPLYNKESSTERNERIKANLKFLDKYVLDHNSYLDDGSKAVKYQLMTLQIKRLRKLITFNGNVPKSAKDEGASKSTFRNTIRAISKKNKFFEILVDLILHSNELFHDNADLENIINELKATASKENKAKRALEEEAVAKAEKESQLKAEEQATEIFTNTRLKGERELIFESNTDTPYQEWSDWLNSALNRFKWEPRLEAIRREIKRIEPLLEGKKAVTSEIIQCRLYLPSRCLYEAEEGKDFCFIHRNTDRTLLTKIDEIYYFTDHIDGDNYLGKPFFNLPRFNTDTDFIESNEVSFEDRIGDIWKETMRSIFDEYPDIKLTEIFDFVQYSLDEEQIYVKIKEISDWYKSTQKDEDHPVEILDAKYRFYLNRNPYKDFLDNGLPVLDEEKVEEYLDANPYADLNEISNETSVSKQRVSQICRDLGIPVGGQRKEYGVRKPTGFSSVTNKRYNCTKCGKESKVWEESNLAKSNLCADCYRSRS